MPSFFVIFRLNIKKIILKISFIFLYSKRRIFEAPNFIVSQLIVAEVVKAHPDRFAVFATLLMSSPEDDVALKVPI